MSLSARLPITRRKRGLARAVCTRSVEVACLGKGMGPAAIAKAREMGVTVPAELSDPDARLTPALVVPFLRDVAHHVFPLLGGNAR